MKSILLAIVLLLLTACAGLGGAGYGQMNADQIAAAVKDKNSSASCIEFTGTGGQFRALSLNNDSGVIKSGTATLDCGSAKATFSNGAKP